jgi:hypothetical protein
MLYQEAGIIGAGEGFAIGESCQWPVASGQLRVLFLATGNWQLATPSTDNRQLSPLATDNFPVKILP